MRESFLVKRVWGDQAPPLPFQPRSAGMNFLHRGQIDEQFPDGFVEVCWVKQGICEIELNGARLPVAAGECVWRMPGEIRYKCALTEPAIVWWATFDGAEAADFLRGFGYPRAVLKPGFCPDGLFEQIVRGLLIRTPDAPRRLVPLFAELIALTGGGQDAEPEPDRRIDECLFLCHTQYAELGFNVNTWADAQKIHRTTLDRMMREATGQTPLAYLTGLRLEHGLDLLANTRMSVAEITRRIGFRQSCYFCRLVRRKTGLSPLAYRQNASPQE